MLHSVQYSNGGSPRASDVLAAAVDYSADTVTDLAGPIDTYAGIVRGYAEGDLTFTANQYNGSYNNGEFEVAGTYLAPGTPVYLHTDHGHQNGGAPLWASSFGLCVPMGATPAPSPQTPPRTTGHRYGRQMAKHC